MRDRDLTARYEGRLEVEDSEEWGAAMAEYNREADAITAAILSCLRPEYGATGVEPATSSLGSCLGPCGARVFRRR